MSNSMSYFILFFCFLVSRKERWKKYIISLWTPTTCFALSLGWFPCHEVVIYYALLIIIRRASRESSHTLKKKLFLPHSWTSRYNQRTIIQHSFNKLWAISVFFLEICPAWMDKRGSLVFFLSLLKRKWEETCFLSSCSTPLDNKWARKTKKRFFFVTFTTRRKMQQRW